VSFVTESGSHKRGEPFAVIRGPGLLQQENVRVESAAGRHDVERRAPTIDAGMKVEGRDHELWHQKATLPGEPAQPRSL
jgi:hypothetical protein